MRLPKMTETERAIFAASYSWEISRRSSVDCAAAEEALDAAIWSIECFRLALRSRKP